MTEPDRPERLSLHSIDVELSPKNTARIIPVTVKTRFAAEAALIRLG